MSTLFISDLHLSDERQNITDLFLNFLDQRASQADALYILGDLFEVWLGDDMIMPEYKASLSKIKQLCDKGIPVYVMYGNRDFLMTKQFETLTGASIIKDPTIINLYGVETLLMHGDTLCTDDIDYMKFRSMVRNPEFIADFLAKSPEERLAIAAKFRQASKTEMASKTMEIMDVNQLSVEAIMLKHNVKQLIHGHTHRPAVHDFSVEDKEMKRIVLGDWYESGSVLVCNETGCQLEAV